MAENKIDKKTALTQAFWDTVDVALWSGIPATGVTGLLLGLSKLLEEQFDVTVTGYVALIPFVGPVINTLLFFVRRYREYVTGKKELKES